jgi:hypothetical protein
MYKIANSMRRRRYIDMSLMRYFLALVCAIALSAATAFAQSPSPSPSASASASPTPSPSPSASPTPSRQAKVPVLQIAGTLTLAGDGSASGTVRASRCAESATYAPAGLATASPSASPTATISPSPSASPGATPGGGSNTVQATLTVTSSSKCGVSETYALVPVVLASTPSLSQAGSFVGETLGGAGEYWVVDLGTGQIYVQLIGNQPRSTTP